METPSKPQDHPQNQQAMAYNHNPPSSTTGYAYPAGSTPATNRYIPTAPTSSSSGKSPIDVVSNYLIKRRQKFQEVSKQIEETTGHLWTHLKTGSSVADTAWGRLTQGTKLLCEGGFEQVCRQTFETAPEEQLRDTFACYLSTSAKPVSGTIYISSKKIAFCSDRPLSYQSVPGQTLSSYYKVVIPLNKVHVINPTSNPVNPAEKYIQVYTVDSHEFWFMGFVNYEKALKNLQEAHVLLHQNI